MAREGYDVDRLSTDVRYVDNDINLDSVSLPVPDTGGVGDADPTIDM